MSFKEKVLIFLLTINLFFTFKVYMSLQESTVILNSSIDKVSVSTSEKINDLEEKVNSSIANINIAKQEVSYIPKDDDTDIELKTSPSKIVIKVNDGKKYRFNLLPTENYKFEDGKLLINSIYAANIDVTSNDYKKSKWSLLTALNSDKKAIWGVNYELGHVVSATAIAGQGIKPYYGLTFRIGAHD